MTMKRGTASKLNLLTESPKLKISCPSPALLGGAERSRVPVMASLYRYNDAAKVTARIAQALDARVAAVKVHEFDLDVIEFSRQRQPDYRSLPTIHMAKYCAPPP